MFVTRALLTILFVLNVYAWLSFVAEEDEKLTVTNAGAAYADRRLQNEDLFYSLHHSGTCPADNSANGDDATTDLVAGDCDATLYDDFNMYDEMFNMNTADGTGDDDGDSGIFLIATSSAYEGWALDAGADTYTVTVGKYGAAPAGTEQTVVVANGDVTSLTRVDGDKRDRNKDLFSNLYEIPDASVDCDGNLKIDVVVAPPADGGVTPDVVKTNFEVVLVKGVTGPAISLTVDSDSSSWTAVSGGTSTASLSFKIPRFADNACISYKSNAIHTGDWAADFYDDASEDINGAECTLKCTDDAPCYCNTRDELNDVRHVFDIITSTGNTGSSFIGLVYELCSMAGNFPMFLFIWVALPSSSYLVFSTYKYTNRHYADWWDPLSTNNNGLMGLIGLTFIYVVIYTFILVLRSNASYRDKAVDIVRSIFGENGAATFRGILDDSMAATQPTRSVELSRSYGGNGKAKTFKAAAVSGASNL